MDWRQGRVVSVSGDEAQNGQGGLHLVVEEAQPQLRKPPLYQVVLLNDDDHSYEYVIELSQRLFGCTKERGYQIAKAVDAEWRRGWTLCFSADFAVFSVSSMVRLATPVKARYRAPFVVTS